MKNSNDTIGNRSRDLPVCSAVPQPLRYRVPQLTAVGILILIFIFSDFCIILHTAFCVCFYVSNQKGFHYPVNFINACIYMAPISYTADLNISCLILVVYLRVKLIRFYSFNVSSNDCIRSSDNMSMLPVGKAVSTLL
jgi:hypothetical protein